MTASILIPLLSGLATGLGGAVVLFRGSSGLKGLSLLLGAAAGIGFTIVFFDLLPSAVEFGSYGIAAAGFFSGVVLGRIVDFMLPHLHIGESCPSCSHERLRIVNCHAAGGGTLKKTAYLLATGMSLHNLPEGLAIGAGFEANEKIGLMLALAIGLHNIPEGMALAGLLRTSGQKKVNAVIVTSVVGLFIPAGAYVSQGLFMISRGSISFLLALGAGTLLYVVWSELIPESCKMHRVFSRVGIVGGFLLSLMLSFYN